ncbi:MAG: peptide/nickel transport system permease protein [Chloroflexota bacterium]|jgi:peptide/nickel transport system permease protein|nr:peptide/nickel transport system permease protein [Chloroflexota bacterium]
MMAFVGRRLAAVVLQVLLVTFIAYALFFVVSTATGATPEQRVAGRTATPEQVARVAQLLGTDRPIYEQYLRFLGGVAQGDFGYSFAYRQPVSNLLFPAAGVTAALVGLAAVLWMALAIPLGLAGALRVGSRLDRLLTAITQFGISAPVFWVAPMLVYFLAFQPSQGMFLGIDLGRSVTVFPLQGYVEFAKSPLEWLRHLLLPALALSIGFAAFYARFVRALVREQLDKEYVLVARAKGLSTAGLVRHHIGPVVAPAMIILLGLDVGATLGGALFVEQTFGLPGIGFLAVSSIRNLDYPMTVGAITLAALMAVLVNMVADLVQAAIDPRVRRTA